MQISLKKSMIWNTAGNITYLLAQWLVTVFVTRIGGYDNAGILSLAMSIATFFSVITLSVRNYQVSDANSLYTSSDYVYHRILMCGLSFVLCGIFVLVNSYDLITSLAIMAYMLVKLVEGFADVLHGIAQKKWRLDIAGKSFILRGVLLLVSFLAAMYLTENLAIAVFAMAVTTLLALILYDYTSVKRIEHFEIRSERRSVISLSKVCMPMIAYGACINAIIPFAKYVLEIYHGKEVLGYYASVATIAVLIQAFFSFVFTPLIGIFEEAYSRDDRKAILSLLVKLIGVLLGTTLLAFAAIAIAGEFAMTLVFGETIRDYVYLLYPTVIASTLTATVWLTGMLLVVMRDLKILLIGAFVGFVTGAILAVALIPDTVYDGTNVSIIVALSVIALIYCMRFTVYFLKKRITEEN